MINYDVLPLVTSHEQAEWWNETPSQDEINIRENWEAQIDLDVKVRYFILGTSMKKQNK